MRRTISLGVLIALLVSLSLCQAQNLGFSQLPDCAIECVNSTLTSTSCQPLVNLDASCACRDENLLLQTKLCFATACNRKDVFRALNVTDVACNEPVRTKSDSYRVIISTFFGLALVALASQWIARSTVGRLSWLDDGNMVIVLIVDVVLCGVCLKMSNTGLGHDMWKLEFDNITSTLLYFWISEIAYFLTLGFIKNCFLLFYLQIFPEKRFRMVVWSVIGFNMLSVFAFALAATFVCTPVSFAWKQWDGEHTGKCVNNNSLAFSHAAISIFLDFVALSLPITQIWKLHLAMKKKIGVLLMFSVGAVVTVVSILRLRSLVHFANTTDMTWDYLEASLWSVIECQVGIICACMPAIRLGLTRLFPKLLGSTHQSTSKNAYTGGAQSGRSQGHTLTTLNANEISVQTSFRVSHARKPQTNDDQRSFVQLVEIDADSKSTGS